jgi:hypothetical protein
MSEGKIKKDGVCFRTDFVQSFATLKDFRTAFTDIDPEILKEVWNEAKPNNPKTAKPKRGSDSDSSTGDEHRADGEPEQGTTVDGSE